jgi:hypothetical protein
MSLPATTSTPPVRVQQDAPRPLHSRPRRFKAIALVVAVAVLICVAVVLYVKIWPFSQKSVLQDLAEASDSQVTIQNYQPTHFPPGCVLEGVEFRHGSDHFKLITIEKLVIEGSYLGILQSHVPRITAVGAHVYVPRGNVSFETQHSKTVVDEIVANGSIVEFESREARHKPLRFDVHESTFKDVRWAEPLRYHLKFRNPDPRGEISVDGKFGPWTKGRPEATPLSGDYSFDRADLGVYEGISGILSSQGKFEGALQHLNVAGITEVPDFKVKTSTHKFKLTTKFDAYVDGLNGDTFLNRVEARFGRTTVLASGSVAGIKGRKGKFTNIQFSSRQGRIEDILGLFTKERAPMSGETSLRAKAAFPPDDGPFLHKLILEGTFGIDEGNFTKPDTQKGVDTLSAGARGQNREDPETVMTDLKGQVKLSNAIAQFSDISFGIPGAKAQMHGTYSIVEPHRVNLHGIMRVDANISKTTSGMKSLLLKILDPIFKKKKHGEIVPVHILGTYDKPDFGLDLGTNQNPQK